MITVTDSRLEPALQFLSQKEKNKKPLMKTIAGIIDFAISENFRTEGSRLGKPWPKLSPKTIKQREKLHLWPGKILNRHGASGLEGSFTQKYDDNSAQAGTNKRYAAIHNFGGTIRQAPHSEIFARLRKKKSGQFKRLRKNNRPFAKGFTFKARTIVIPPRPFLKLNKDDIQRIKSAITNFLTH